MDAVRPSLFDDIETVRNDGPVVYLIGDSIFRGFALGEFEVPNDNPNAELNRVGRIFDLLCKQNGSNQRTCYWGGDFQRILGLSAYCQEGDCIIFEDAGVYARNYEILRNYFAVSLDAAALIPGVNVFTLTNFALPEAPEWANFNLPLDDENRTGNDAIRASLTEDRHGLIDIDKAFEAFQAEFAELLEASLVRNDGYHPNLFGNIVMGVMLFACTHGEPAKDLSPLFKTLENGWSESSGRHGVPETYDAEQIEALLVKSAQTAEQWIQRAPLYSARQRQAQAQAR